MGCGVFMAYSRFNFFNRAVSISHKVFLKVALQKSTPPQIRRLILHYYLYKEQVDGFVRALTFELAAPPRGEDAHARTREVAGRPPGSVILFLGQLQRQLPDLSIVSHIA